MNPHVGQRILHIFQLEMPHDRFNFFHGTNLPIEWQ
jgi:hypothetical protein